MTEYRLPITDDASSQRGEVFCGQRHDSEHAGAMAGAVAVKIRPARDGEAEVPGQGAVARFGRGVVIDVPGFERVQARGGERGQEIVALRDPGVRERGDPAGLVDDGDDLLGTSASARHKGGAAELEKAAEGLVAREDVAGSQQRRGHVGPADALAARGGGENRRDIDRCTKRGKPLAHLSDSAQPVLMLAVEKRAQARAGRIDEIAEHVHIAPVGNRADFDPRDELDAGFARGGRRRLAAGGRVVIGDAENGKARSAGLSNELRRRQGAVGGGRVKVKVDQTLNEDPQPQVDLAFGFLMVKPPPVTLSTKSTSAPRR